MCLLVTTASKCNVLTDCMLRHRTFTVCRDFRCPSCMRLILHSVLAMKTGQVQAESYTEHVKCTQAEGHDSKGLLSDKHEDTHQ